MITQLLNILTIAACLQIANPVHISSEMKELERGEAELVFTASIDAGWHVYSTELGNDGPISATFNAVKMEGAELVGKLQARGKEIKQYDKLFDMDVRYFEKAVTFVQKIRFTKPTYDIDCYVEYGACNDRSCLPPSKANLRLSGKSPRPPHMEGQIPPPRPDDGEMAPSPDNGQQPPKPEDSNMNPDPVAEAGANTDSTAMGESDLSQLWQPVVNELQHVDHHDTQAVGRRLADGFGAVFVALQEEGYSHRDDGPHARGEEGDETAQQSFEEDDPPRHSFRSACIAVIVLQFVDDRLPQLR